MAQEIIRIKTAAGLFHVPKKSINNFKQVCNQLGISYFEESEHVLCETRREWECQLSLYHSSREKAHE